MKRAPTIEVFTFMAKHGLTLVDLTEVGGEDLKSPNPKKAEKARRVEKCWSLMARLGIKFRDLENSPSADTRQAEPQATWRGSLFRSV